MMRRLNLFGALATAFLSVVLIRHSAALAAEPEKESGGEKAATGLPADWFKEYEIPGVTDPQTGTVRQQKSTLRLWEELGWLNAKYERPEQGLQWQVVLARATDPKPPEVRIDGGLMPGFEVKYGPYWLRDHRGSLRMLREKKTADSPTWPPMPIDKQATKITFATLNFLDGQTHALMTWRIGDWLWLAAGLRDNAANQERYDIWMRLQHRDLPLSGRSLGSMISGSGFAVDFTEVQQRGHYEADLFLATRSLANEDDVARLIAEAKLKSANDPNVIVGKPAPKIVAENWVNVPEGTNAVDLMKDTPTLVMFWSARDAEAGQRMWECEQLYRKFKDRGFVVLALHPTRDSKEADEIVKVKDVSFPVGSDSNAAQNVRSGANALSFRARSSPACFLIDKTGKVTWGNSKALPTAEQIEALLK
jgi:peroxiredoxin